MLAVSLLVLLSVAVASSEADSVHRHYTDRTYRSHNGKQVQCRSDDRRYIAKDCTLESDE